MDTLNDYAAYLAAGGRRPNTIHKRLYHLERLQRDHPNLLTITPAELVEWFARHEWAPETRKNFRQTVRGFYGWAVLMGHLDTSPAEVLPAVHIPRRRRPLLGEAVIEAALARASTRDRLMLLLGSRAGLRRGEIAGLRWADVTDLHVFVRDGKGGASRVVPLGAALAVELAAERARRAEGVLGEGWRFQVDPASEYVFPAQAGGHMSADTVGAVITRALEAGTSHALRRRFATRAFRGTHDIRAVQELLGHASVTTTQLYVVVDDDQLWAAVEAAA